MWHTERSGSDKGGGGLTLIYKETISAHHWTPPVPDKLQYIMNERQWLLLGNKCAFLHIYIACQTTRNDSYLQWNEDLFHLVTQEAILLRRQGICCLAMGDFNTRVGTLDGLEGNTPDTNSNFPMFTTFIQQVNMTILNTLPISQGLFTRFMDKAGTTGSKSLLDYGLIDNDHLNTVTSFTIDEDARFACGSDHALLECLIEVGDRPSIHWSYSEAVHYNITPSTNYAEYKTYLDTKISCIPLHNFEQLPVTEMLPHISETINKSAMCTIGLKVKKVKHGRKLPQHIIKMIRTKTQLTRDLAQLDPSSPTAQVEEMEEHLDLLRADIKDSLSGLNLQRRQRLRSRLLKADPTRKKFWRFLKTQLKSAGNITAICDNTGKMVFLQPEVEGAVMGHFTSVFDGQRTPVFPDSPVISTQAELTLRELDLVISTTTCSFAPTMFEHEICSPYTFTELADELAALQDSKASGYDGIANELLKNTGFRFRLYLQTFLNRILKDGHVPQDLNIGKCLLVHKVWKLEII